MVVDSLRVFMDKYPFFFDKNEGSNFYRVSKVNNSHFQRLYNDLFKVYESFHISKKVLVWKEQVLPYEYNINFVANYKNIKDVTIYKNDYPIYFKEYSKKDEKNDFIYTYKCRYLLNNGNILNVYQCTDCGTIYFTNNMSVYCDNCGNNTYRKLNTYECMECGEIYFSDEPITDCTKNNHPNKVEQVNIYECNTCKEIYITKEIPEVCDNCGINLNPVNINSINYNLNYNDNIRLDDNRNIVNVNQYEEISGSYKKYHFILTDYNEPVIVKIYKDNTIKDTIVLSSENNWEDYSKDLPSEYDYTLHYTPDDIDLEVNVEETYTYEDLIETTNESNDNLTVDIPIPVIPDDKFIIKINTYDEYSIVKGFPENDEVKRNNRGKYIPSIYDHDVSLDELGALNNIPRKKYNIITDETLYPYTEPPYNNRASEDDYHYMNRILEYNTRLWSMNPVSLELWKMYGIESELINRERYLLKVFDETRHPFNEDTGLVKCWTPLPWEHKDRFCDANIMSKVYFVAVADNINPLLNEYVDVKFRLINSLGEDVNTPFKVDVFKLDVDDEEVLIKKDFSEDKFRIHPAYFNNPYINDNVEGYNSEDYYNTFRFKCYDLNGNPLNVDDDGELIAVDIILMLRDYYNSDIHVDNQAYKDYNVSASMYSEEYANGSLDYPFLTLQEAINHTTGNNNIIGVNLRDLTDAKYIINDTPLLINHDTKIVGNIYFQDDDYTTGYVPRIVNRSGDKSFFKVLGGKNINLTLSNLCLIRGTLKSFINISAWENNNAGLEDYENVIIHGGAVNISTSFTDDGSYYPYDFVHLKVVLTNDKDEVLPSNMVRVYYENHVVGEGVTDEDGIVEFTLNIDSKVKGKFNLNIGNISDTFFESIISYEVNITEDYSPYSIFGKFDDKNITYGDTVKFLTDNQYLGNVKLYRDDVGLWKDNVNLDSFAIQVFNERYTAYVTRDDSIDGEVIDEWFIECSFKVSSFINKLQRLPNWTGKLVKDLTFNHTTGDLEYNQITITEDSTLNDFTGTVIDVRLSDDEEDLIVETFTPTSTGEYLNYNDTRVLENLIYNINFTENGILEFDRVGQL